ncbi:DUF5689 domain-containing protein [Flavobacteriaceae bacterium KMM 6897]|nr:DUF5689 domain-containing protein [Flavobacteriaceae bacterium KMM 6897]MEB8346040.1 DUF5689 domain-containing protein [Flavobacteriaceae bacterium KMM 6898]
MDTMKFNNRLILILTMLSALLVGGCVADRSFDVPEIECGEGLVANTSFGELRGMYVDGVFQIQDDLVLEGYINSSDQAGNFFGTMHLQDDSQSPEHGLQIELDVRDYHLLYPKGSKVYIKLKGLYLGKGNDSYKLGAVFSSFGNLSVGRLPVAAVQQHIINSCNPASELQATLTGLESLDDVPLNTLVEFSDMEIVEGDLGDTYAHYQVETKRSLKNCEDLNITLLNSGYSDFQSELLPEGNGNIKGILLKSKNEYQLVIRNLEDLNFSNERCKILPTEFTSDAVFISELADPNNNPGARFVELFNSASQPLDLNGWTLIRYTNANTEASSSLDLSGLQIGASKTLVISPNKEEFELVYGFAPNLGVSTNSPADSNGDDNLVLVDPFGMVMDIFGIPGEDGSGTNHEFEDGRAVRIDGITKGNSIFTFEEWMIYNDTGDSGTINLPQNAPEDFTPGFHE